MLSPRKKKLIVFGYFLLSLAVIAVTIILVAIAQGRYLDLKTRTFSERGMILLDSEPGSAQAFVKGKPLKKDTPTRVLLPRGNYEVVMSKDGYRDWRKTLRVNNAEVTWADYALLLPRTITTSQLASADNITTITQSPDQKYLAYATAEARPQVFTLKTAKDEKPKPLFRLPRNLSNSQIQQITWSPESEYLLLTIKQAGRTMYYVVNAFNSTSYDLAKIYKSTPLNLSFGTSWNELYDLDKGNLRRLDLVSNNPATALLQNVQSYYSSSDGLVAVQAGKNTLNLMRVARTGDPETIGRLDTDNYQLMTQQFEDGLYVVALAKKSGITSIYRVNGQTSLVKAINTFKAASISGSPNGRFVLLQNQNQFLSFDLETLISRSFALNHSRVTNVVWFDKYHLLGQANGATIMFEFDGGNVEEIGSSNNLFPAFSGKPTKLIYSIGRSNITTKPVLQISSLTRE